MLARLRWNAYLAYHLIGQARYPFRPLETIRRDQSRRVRAMVAYAYRWVPYYRETLDRLGLTPADFRSAEDLARLPILGRDVLQRDPLYLTSTAQPVASYLGASSGGSTGAPRTVHHDAAALFQNAAHAERERSLIGDLVGRRLGYREAMLTSPESTGAKVQAFCARTGYYPSGMRIDRLHLSLQEPPETNLPRLNAFRPDVIQSYGSYLDWLFSYLDASGAPFERPRVITYSSDGLSPATRRIIMERYGIALLSTYQAVEAFKIGFECLEHRGLHLNIDLYPVRIVDARDQDVAPGQSGEVVVSNLVNRGTVLLNYRLGDIATLLPDPCTCGRTLPLLSFVEGRSDDLIETPEGRVLHPQAIRGIFTHEASVWEYQVAQKRRDYLVVSVIASTTCDREALCTRLQTRFAQTLGGGASVDIVFVDAIPRTPGGKHRAVLGLAADQNRDG
ncbi:MAG: phenylacetate--CoA ligase family protein [Anaerolineae bacterium]